MIDERFVPDTVKVAAIRATLVGAKEGDGDVIASACLAQSVEGLMEVSDEVNQKPERGGTFLRRKSGVAKLAFEVEDAVGDTVAPG